MADKHLTAAHTLPPSDFTIKRTVYLCISNHAMQCMQWSLTQLS